MSYEVTATRKRPQDFSQLAGQDFVSATLSASISTGRIAHAYLFSGPRGCGKTSTARILAKALNCERGPTDSPCGVCHSCTSITAGSALDVIEIDGASNTSVDNIRQIKDEVLFPPNGSRYKIYIIDEVHMLSNSAFNALLKTIEEPPPYIVFIFATTELHKVPATIKSRCQQFAFRLFGVETVKSLLATVAREMGIEAEDEALLWIAKESGGSLRDAYTLFDQVVSFSAGTIRASTIREKLGLVGMDRLNALYASCLRAETGQALASLDSILSQGVSAEQFVIDSVEFFRALLLLSVGIERESLLGSTPASFDPALVTGFGAEKLERALALLLELYRTIRYTVEQRFEVELAVARLCRLSEFVSPSELGKTVAAMRRYLAGEYQAATGRAPVRPAVQAPGLAAPAISPGTASEGKQGSNTATGEGTGNEGREKPAEIVNSEGPENEGSALFIDDDAPEACQEDIPGIDLETLRSEVTTEAGRASPLLRNGLESSGTWCLSDHVLVIPYAATGIGQTLVKESVGLLAEVVSRKVGRAIRIEVQAGSQPVRALPAQGRGPAVSGHRADGKSASPVPVSSPSGGFHSISIPKDSGVTPGGGGIVKSGTLQGNANSPGDSGFPKDAASAGNALPAGASSPAGGASPSGKANLAGPASPGPASGSPGIGSPGTGNPGAGSTALPVLNETSSPGYLEEGIPGNLDFMANFHESLAARDSGGPSQSLAGYPRAGSAGSAGQNVDEDDPVRMVEQLFRGQRVIPKPERKSDDGRQGFGSPGN